jgi:transcriptional regulator with XRE-family HTH domain
MTDVMTLSMRIAEEIRVLMVRKRVNQKQLAQRLDVSAMWVSGRLTGQTEIAVNDLPRIANALEVSVLDLLPKQVRTADSSATMDRNSPQPERPIPVQRRPADHRPNGHPAAGAPPGPRRTARVARPSHP